MTAMKPMKPYVFFGLSAAILLFPAAAFAAPLNYAADTSILLSQPGVTLTVTSGSVADGLIVNATSVAVTLSGSTGGTFTLTSPQALASSTTGSGGVLTQSCSSGVETDAITQSSASATYTLTPTGSACAAATPPPSPAPSSTPPASEPSVSVGVASGYAPPAPAAGNTATTSTTTTNTSSGSFSDDALRAEIVTLQAQLASLIAQANNIQPASPTTGLVFSRDLRIGMTGNDVKRLQNYLIAQNAGPAARALAKHGTTLNFGVLTQAALA